MGKRYIVEPDESINNEVYKYTHFVAWESEFKVIL